MDNSNVQPEGGGKHNPPSNEFSRVEITKEDLILQLHNAYLVYLGEDELDNLGSQGSFQYVLDRVTLMIDLADEQAAADYIDSLSIGTGTRIALRSFLDSEYVSARYPEQLKEQKQLRSARRKITRLMKRRDIGSASQYLDSLELPEEYMIVLNELFNFYNSYYRTSPVDTIELTKQLLDHKQYEAARVLAWTVESPNIAARVKIAIAESTANETDLECSLRATTTMGDQNKRNLFLRRIASIYATQERWPEVIKLVGLMHPLNERGGRGEMADFASVMRSFLRTGHMQAGFWAYNYGVMYYKYREMKNSEKEIVRGLIKESNVGEALRFIDHSSHFTDIYSKLELISTAAKQMAELGSWKDGLSLVDEYFKTYDYRRADDLNRRRLALSTRKAIVSTMARSIAASRNASS